MPSGDAVSGATPVGMLSPGAASAEAMASLAPEASPVPKIIFKGGGEFAPLYRRYPGQFEPQDAYVELDCGNKTLDATWNSEIGNGVPFTVWHGHDKRFGIPHSLRGSAVLSLLEEIQPLAQMVVDGYERRWDENNHVARFTAEAEEALEQIGAICSDLESCGDSDYFQTSDGSDWISGSTLQDLVKEGESFADAASRLAKEAEREGYLVDPDEIETRIEHEADREMSKTFAYCQRHLTAEVLVENMLTQHDLERLVNEPLPQRLEVSGWEGLVVLASDGLCGWPEIENSRNLGFTLVTDPAVKIREAARARLAELTKDTPGAPS